MLFGRKTTMIDPAKALKGSEHRIPVAAAHAVLGTPLDGPYPDGLEVAYVAEGCFWGAEHSFWQTPGVFSTSVGYQGGYTANPSYEQVCSARTGHAEVVRIVFDPAKLSYPQLLKVFWEGHNPTQGMRQGMDLGTQYRSAIYATSDAQLADAVASREAFQQQLKAAGYGEITTEIIPAEEFYPAEDYHQQYLAKVPGGYCGHGGTGVSCPVGVAKAED